jgi:group I intron endonuclease
MSNKAYIYLIKNSINEKVYVGQTLREVSKRWRQHIKDLKYSNRQNKIYRAMRKHGFENFHYEILEEVENYTPEILDELETKYITQYDSYSNGYNETRGGRRGSIGYKHRPESILKMKENTKKKFGKENPNYGGKNYTDKSKKRMSEAKQGLYDGNKNPMYKRTIYSIWLEKYGKEEADKRRTIWMEMFKLD